MQLIIVIFSTLSEEYHIHFIKMKEIYSYVVLKVKDTWQSKLTVLVFWNFYLSR